MGANGADAADAARIMRGVFGLKSAEHAARLVTGGVHPDDLAEWMLRLEARRGPWTGRGAPVATRNDWRPTSTAVVRSSHAPETGSQAEARFDLTKTSDDVLRLMTKLVDQARRPRAPKRYFKMSRGTWKRLRAAVGDDAEQLLEKKGSGRPDERGRFHEWAARLAVNPDRVLLPPRAAKKNAHGPAL